MLKTLLSWSVYSVVAAVAILSSASVPGQTVLIQDDEAVIEKHRQAVMALQTKRDQRIEQLRGLEAEIDRRSSMVGQLEQTLFDANLSMQSYPEVLAMLQTMRVQLKVDLAGLRTRQKMIREFYPVDDKEDQVNQKKLAIAESMLELAQQRVERAELLVEKGTIPTSDLSAAQIELRQAELRVLESQSTILHARQQSTQDNREIVIELSEKEAKLTEVESLLKSAAEARSTIREIETLQQANRRMETETQNVSAALATLQDELITRSEKLKQLEAELSKLLDKSK